MGGKIPLGRWLGVPVALDWSGVAIVLLVWLALGLAYYPDTFPFVPGPWLWLAALIATLIFFATILGHEFAHALVARRRGVTVRRITLNLLGGLAEIEQDAPRPLDEFLISAAGPLASLGFAGGFYGLQRALEAAAPPGAAGLGTAGALMAVSAGYLATINVWLALFNSIPGFPLDGGRVLRAILWRLNGNFVQATQQATVVGRVIAGLLIFYGAARVLQGEVADAWFLLVGWFLYSTAQQHMQQVRVQATLRGVPVKRIMHTDFAWAPAGLAVGEAWQHYFARQTRPGLPVIAEGRFAGLLTHRDLQRIPAAAWATTPVSAAMTPVTALATVAPHDSVEGLLRLFQARQIQQAPVLLDGCLVGLVSQADLLGILPRAG